MCFGGGSYDTLSRIRITIRGSHGKYDYQKQSSTLECRKGERKKIMKRLDGNWEEFPKTSKAGGSEDYEKCLDMDGNEVVISRDCKEGVAVYVCSRTGERLTWDDVDGGLIVDKRNLVYSKEYAEEHMLQCSVCGVWFKSTSDEGVVTENGWCYCKGCVGEYAYQCDECGEWHDAEHYHTYEDYLGSGGITGIDTNDDTVHICERCAEDFQFCDECHRIVYCDLVCSTDDWNTLCEECFNKKEEKVLHRYHFDGDQTDYNMPYLGKETRRDNPLMGVEAEMDLGGEDEEKIQEIIEDFGEQYCVACEDGSLTDGFELISCPANLDNHLTTLNWRGAFTTARMLGYKAHDPGTCGLHVHVDRKFFYNSMLSSTEIEGAMFIVLKNNVDWIKRFSRRFKYGYCEINGEDDGETIKNMEDYDKKWNKKEALRKRDRYKAINFSRSDTIEFRIFRGTLNIDTLYATLQFVDIFSRLVKNCVYLDDAMDISLESFIDYAGHDPKYKQFVDYCRSIGLIDNNETGY